MKIDHSLKTEQPWFDLVAEGVKNFEIRKNDRNFQEGEIIELLEYDRKNDEFSGDEIIAKIELVCDYAQQENYLVLGIKVLSIKLKGTN